MKTALGSGQISLGLRDVKSHEGSQSDHVILALKGGRINVG
jgi:hypothetical protein